MSAGTYLHQNMVRSPHALNHVSVYKVLILCPENYVMDSKYERSHIV